MSRWILNLALLGVASPALACPGQMATPVLPAAVLFNDVQPTLAEAIASQERSRCLTALGRDTLRGYQKQTAFDNTPYRFNMKPGQKLSADEFDAWMQSRGIRIVRAKTAVEPAATTAQTVAQ